jgi:hypothetical protein
MDFLANLMWVIAAGIGLLLGCALFGGFIAENDKAKANRYLANKYDQEKHL